MTKADRLLRTLLLLQLHGRMTAGQLAKRLEVSERTVLRDMESLGSAGVPVLAERGAGGGWELMQGYRTTLTAMSGAEVKALFVAVPASLLADLNLGEASDAATLKLESLLPAMSRNDAELARQRIHIDVRGWSGSRDPVPQLPLLQEAVWRERKVRIEYDRGNGCVTNRALAPLGLVAKGSVWYLVALTDEGELRSYRVSRIREAEILDSGFERPRDFDLAAFWESSSARFQERLPRYEAVIRAETAALPWIRSMIRFGAVDSVAGDERAGWSRVALHFDAFEAARHTLLGLAASVEVLEPAALRDAIVDAARAVVSAAAVPATPADRTPAAAARSARGRRAPRRP
jgi:predicted DNA-binding transcriptional regulator YafY